MLMGTSNTRTGGSVMVGGYWGQVIPHIFGNPCITTLPAGKPMSLQEEKRWEVELG